MISKKIQEPQALSRGNEKSWGARSLLPLNAYGPFLIKLFSYRSKAINLNHISVNQQNNAGSGTQNYSLENINETHSIVPHL